MSEVSFNEVLRRSGNAIIFIFVTLILGGAVLYWIVETRYQDFLDNHQLLAERSLAATANEIESYISHSRQLARLLVKSNSDEIELLTSYPEDNELHERVASSVKQFFPEAFNFTIADKSGNLKLKDPNQFVGKGCKADIQGFSSGVHLNEIFIHSNPDPENYHFDVLTKIDVTRNGVEGIFFVSLDTQILRRLISNGQQTDHSYFLLRKDRDGLIEMTAQGTRAQLERVKYLSEDELQSIIAKVEVKGTRWLLVDILDLVIIANFRKELMKDVFIIAAIFIGFALIFLGLIILSEKQRLTAEKEIFKLNETLENRVVQRTAQLQESQQELNFQSTHDQLTGLLNRKEFERRLLDLITRAKTDESESVVLYLDIDHFKVLNDTVGHFAGDMYLKQLASLLPSQLRKCDTLARLGGDEFGILLSECTLERASVIAEELRQNVNEYDFEWEGRKHRISASIGVVIINRFVSDVKEVMSHVDTACFTAKDAGRNTIHLFDGDDDATRVRQNEMYWATEALQAIEKGRVVLYGQEIRAIKGEDNQKWIEVLVRLEDAKGNLLLPYQFIPALERYGGIIELDKAVVRKSIKLLSENHDVCININLSGASIGNADFLTFLETQCEKCTADPSHVVFEITETAAVSNIVVAKTFISSMKHKGCRLALDDFGSGMSSFGYLKNLDVDYIKLDGSFVKDIDTNAVHYEMVQAMKSVASVMGKKTIAEFVENKAVSESLKEIGISYGQGYYYHKPEPLVF